MAAEYTALEIPRAGIPVAFAKSSKNFDKIAMLDLIVRSLAYQLKNLWTLFKHKTLIFSMRAIGQEEISLSYLLTIAYSTLFT